jgi:hypothetical protein
MAELYLCFLFNCVWLLKWWVSQLVHADTNNEFSGNLMIKNLGSASSGIIRCRGQWAELTVLRLVLLKTV